MSCDEGTADMGWWLGFDYGQGGEAKEERMLNDVALGSDRSFNSKQLKSESPISYGEIMRDVPFMIVEGKRLIEHAIAWPATGGK